MKLRVRWAAFSTAITKQTRSGPRLGNGALVYLMEIGSMYRHSWSGRTSTTRPLDGGHPVRVGRIGDRQGDTGSRRMSLASRSRRRCTRGCGHPPVRPTRPSCAAIRPRGGSSGARSWARREALGHYRESESPFALSSWDIFSGEIGPAARWVMCRRYRRGVRSQICPPCYRRGPTATAAEAGNEPPSHRTPHLNQVEFVEIG